MPTYLNYKYIFFLHIDFRSDLDLEYYQLSQIRIRGKKCQILIPDFRYIKIKKLNLTDFLCRIWRILPERFLHQITGSFTHSQPNKARHSNLKPIKLCKFFYVFSKILRIYFHNIFLIMQEYKSNV